MIGLRIEEAAKAIGRTAEAVSSGDEARQRLRSSAVEGLVVDLGMPRLDLDNLVREARQTGAWLIAFYPHVNVELRRAGERAGVERGALGGTGRNARGCGYGGDDHHEGHR